MSFLNPVFLFALAAVALPLVIHLLNVRKPKRIQFSTLSFFKELQKTTIRKIKVKRWILLLLRFLAIACLAVVLARPFLPPSLSSGGASNQPSLVAILVDNSISMERIGAKGPLIDQAKEMVQVIADASKEQDRFIIQTTNGESVNSSISTANQLKNKTNAISIQQSGAFIKERLSVLFSALDESPYQNKKVYLIGDGSSNVLEIIAEEFEEESKMYSISILEVEHVNVQNTFVEQVGTSSSIVGSGIPFVANVTVKNAGNIIAANQFLTLTVEGETVGQYQLQLEAGVSETFSFEVNPTASGSISGVASIEGDGFTADNQYYFSIHVPDQRNVLWVTESNQNPNEISYTSVIFEAQGDENQLAYTKTTLDDVNSNNLADYDVVLIDKLSNIPEFSFSTLQEFVQQGKGVVIYPSPTANITNYNKFLSLFNAGRFGGVIGDYTSFSPIAKGSVLLEDHPIFEGLFEKDDAEELNFTVPDIYYYLKLQTSNSGLGLNIIEMNNGDPLLHEKRYGEGRVLIYTVGNEPGWSNFPVKALFAPTNYRSLLYAGSLENGGLSNHTLGNTFKWVGNADPQSVELVYNNEPIQISAKNLGGRISIEYNGYDWQPGWVKISDGNKSYTTALNLSTDESEFITAENEISNTEMEHIAIVQAGELSDTEIASAIKTSGFGKEIWHWFMLAGLLLLITETLVSTYYKAETIT